jgi:2-keto-3-deoxy-6-phosphogluconate aldolase
MIKDLYREFYKQAFIPIFVNDGMDALLQAEACVRAGFRVIEFTQRRDDLLESLCRIKSDYPELYVLAGSAVDSSQLVQSQKRHFPHLLNFEEMVSAGIDGFVSMMKFSDRTISRYCRSHLLIPSASTVNEARDLLDAGAHFIKILGPELGLARQISSDPLFKFCPLFLTGGMNIERIAQAFESGAMVVASGFDLTLKGVDDCSAEGICRVMKEYQKAALAARTRLYPALSDALYNQDGDAWLDEVPHYVPESIRVL